MDFHIKQWRNQQLHESEAGQYQYPSAPKMPKLHHHHHHDLDHHITSSALPLFEPEPRITSTKISRTGLGGCFSLAQWQELELQALILRYMIAGAAVPHDLLHHIRTTLLHSSPYFLNSSTSLHHSQPALLQSGYWGRVAMDPEPGRCRRTDGKKWRCSRDVVAGHKYCERHMHRGRNRSRKPVENPTPTAGGPIAAPPLAAVAGGGHFTLDLSSSHSNHVHKNLLDTQNGVTGQGERSDGHVLRPFFDDWPRAVQETDGAGSNTSLSISLPGNSPSDVSLKLSTGTGDEPGSRNGNGEQSQVNWGSGMGGGGPLAEALRSSATASSSSPTSVLHQLPQRDHLRSII